MKKFLLLSILCYTYTVYAQHYIPVKKMISNYKEQKAIDALKNYDIVYNSEGCPIFYSTEKFELEDKGSFWLSETPEVMSKDWGAACYRVCSYVILKENIFIKRRKVE